SWVAISASGKTTRSTPRCLRILPCSSVTPLTNTRLAPSSRACRAASSEVSMFSPKLMNTACALATNNSLSESLSVTLATTASYSTSLSCSTRRSLASTPVTRQPFSANRVASAVPNEPSPSTTKRLFSFIRSAYHDFFFGIHDSVVAPAARQGGEDRNRSEPAKKHQDDQDRLGRGTQMGRNARRQSHGAQRRTDLESGRQGRVLRRL